MGNIILYNGIILTPFKELLDRVLFLKNGKIERIIHLNEFNYYRKDYTKGYKEIDVKNNYVAPGFIDVHTHGANNVSAAEGPYEKMAEFKVKHGTVGFLPTFWNTDIEGIIRACKKICKFMKKKNKGSRILGINSEGPYINPAFGAQNTEYAIVPKFEDYSRILEASNGDLKLMTVAPEVEGFEDLIKYLRLNNVTVAINYTEISVDKLYKSIKQGITYIDHIFDGFGSESVAADKWTKPYGMQEELLICDNLITEVIADRYGEHVHPAWLKIIVRCKGIENIILITDSREIAGNPPGVYTLEDGYKAVIKKGYDTIRLEGTGDLAGCIMTMDDAISNMIRHTGISILDAVRMASYNPARAIKVSNRKGEIKEGMDADIAVFDKNINVKLTIIDGDVEYNNL